MVEDHRAAEIGTPEQLARFRATGYVVLPDVIPAGTTTLLLEDCERLLAAQLADMDRVGATTLGLSHRDKRYSLAARHEECAPLEAFIFSAPILDFVRAILGDEAYLFIELYAVKPPGGIPFSWHQDSGYLLGHPHKPFLALWCALDDVSEENGALCVLARRHTDPPGAALHRKDRQTNDFVGLASETVGEVVPMRSGSILAMSSLLFHRSGTNSTQSWRRALLVAYSPEPIVSRSGQPWDRAIPVIRHGKRVDRDAAT